MQPEHVKVGSVHVHKALYKLVNEEIIPGTGVVPSHFWQSMSEIVSEFAPRNMALLRKRDAIQAEIDSWLLQREGMEWDAGAYTTFLTQIGYIVPVGSKFQVETSNVDDEIAITPGPQLVVPVDNARYALNATNARWGSLLDAFYGTDAGPPETDGAEKGGNYNPVRGARVFERVHSFLDTHFPLKGATSHGDVCMYHMTDNNKTLAIKLNSGEMATLRDNAQLVGFNLTSDGDGEIANLLLKNNGLHVELQFDRASVVGSKHAAGVKDVLLESAVTAIVDCEDSVAAVDAEDKVRVYRNWTGLMKGTLTTSFSKGGKQATRSLNKDKTFVCPTRTGPYPTQTRVPGRACLLVRNVGMHLVSEMVLDHKGQQTPEGLVDAMVTALAALHDLRPGAGKPRELLNSRKGSMYVVKPKLHGPAEVQFTVELFARVEKALGMAPNTIKMGIMDEERRTTVNLYECIRIAKHRCIFINTGFLDRTGDEIHTSFHAGPMMVKADIKTAPWRVAYEQWNVDIGLAVGLVGRGQIGKGMWAKPDEMGAMLKEKGNHPKSGATTAWVPSPTAATLHAIHYHETRVLDVQAKMLQHGRRATLSDILLPPLLSLRASQTPLTPAAITAELENNAQGILGYVVRWVQLGVGCSKVPDASNVGLMEDRATLRIASQHIANWLHHGIISETRVTEAFHKMARVVDRQNAGSKGYSPMAPDFNGNGFMCAMELVLDGLKCPNGLTEHTLTRFRQQEKQQQRLASSSRL